MAPGAARRRLRVEDDKRQSAAAQEVAGRQARLTAANDDDVTIGWVDLAHAAIQSGARADA